MAIGLLRKSLCPLNLDQRLDEIVEGLAIPNEKERTAMKNIVLEFAEYAYLHEIEDEDFVQQLKLAKSDTDSTLEAELVAWAGGRWQVAGSLLSSNCFVA